MYKVDHGAPAKGDGDGDVGRREKSREREGATDDGGREREGTADDGKRERERERATCERDGGGERRAADIVTAQAVGKEEEEKEKGGGAFFRRGSRSCAFEGGTSRHCGNSWWSRSMDNRRAMSPAASDTHSWQSSSSSSSWTPSAPSRSRHGSHSQTWRRGNNYRDGVEDHEREGSSWDRHGSADHTWQHRGGSSGSFGSDNNSNNTNNNNSNTWQKAKGRSQLEGPQGLASGSRAPLCRGVVVKVSSDQAFLRPQTHGTNTIPLASACIDDKDISLLLHGRSTLTGLMEVKPGDVFEYISNGWICNPRTTFACLISCTPRSSFALSHYLHTLLSRSQHRHMPHKGTLRSSSLPIIHQEEEEEEESDHSSTDLSIEEEKDEDPRSSNSFSDYIRNLVKRWESVPSTNVQNRILGSPTSVPVVLKEEEEGGVSGQIVLREITKCPAGFLFALEQSQPTLDIVTSILELSLALSNHSTGLYMAQLRKFYKLFNGSQFLLSPHALQKYIAMLATYDAKDDYRDANKYKNRLIYTFILSLAKSSPGILPSLMPLARIATASQTNGDLNFLLDLFKIASYDKGAPSNLYWDKTPLIPLCGEIHQNTTIPGDLNQFFGVHPVIKKGSYESVENYIDTYFRLLREDCHANLKKGIRDFQSGKLKHGLKTWFNVSVMGIHFGKTSPGLTVALRCGTSGSRHLPKPGSLLCISCDGGKLKFPIWATLRRSDLIEKNKAVFFVAVIDMKKIELDALSSSRSIFSRFVQLIRSSEGMIVLESPAYFQAYEPVLRSLQTLHPERLPFQEEIVHAQWPSIAPDYLMKSRSLNWGCVIKETGITMKEIRAGVYEFDELLKNGFQTVLNDGQKEALEYVLKNRFAMIQGPPGTGKTFLASKILQLILSADAFPEQPLLIIAYKNHALDQILEKCIEFSDSPGSIVRVGGYSSSSILKHLNLRSFQSESRDNFRHDWIQNAKRLEEIKKNIGRVMEDLKRCLLAKIYSSYRWLASVPEQFIYRLLSRRQNGIVLLKQLPEGTSISQVLFERDQVCSEVCKQIAIVMSASLKEWLPHIGVFREVCQCLLSLKGSVKKSNVNPPKNCKGRTESESEDSDSVSDSDSDDNNISEMFKKYDNKDDWLKTDFMTIDLQRNDTILFDFGFEDSDCLEQNMLFQIDPWKLNHEQRCIAVQMILKRNLEEVSIKLHALHEEYNEICSLNAEMNKRKELEILRNAKIIGMTTTGAAMHQDILKALSPSVVIVEEAAEILEPQIMAVLNPGLQHLILIGDHYQLQPAVQCYELEKLYDFGVSMFERLAEHNKLPYKKLSLQSRMRDEFLPLLWQIYPNLQSNLDCVSGARNKVPTCMTRSMFFWTHSFPEKTQQSVENDGEANMVVALALWLVREGNKSDTISIISSYRAQVSLIRRKMICFAELTEVQVFSIDKFQGSENMIVIVSLVRSNDDCKIGHLSTRNRMCVAVSRARGGLYICGNPKTLSASSHWRTTIDHFHAQECLGDTIFLQCPRHSSSPPLLLSCQDSFNFLPNLCQEPCHARINGCGHLCVGKCHTGEHVKCKENMEHVFQSCGHCTTRLCYQNPREMRCNEKISVKIDKCGHTIICECWISKSRVGPKCDVPCTNTLNCGHPCLLYCSEACNSKACEACKEEQKIKELKERERERQEINEKRQEINKKLKQLESEECDESNQVLKTELGTADSMWEFNMVKDRFVKYIQADHKFFPIVTKIEQVHNANLRKKFLEAHLEMINPTKGPQMLFHGTSSKAIDNIIQFGFKLPGKEKSNMYGRGIYFSTDSSKSAQIMYTKGSQKLLLCEVLVGNARCVNKPDPQLNLKKIRDDFFDSVYSERNSRATGGTLFDEYVVYNPWQAYPMYIISFDKIDIEFPEFRRSNYTQDADFVQRSLKPSQDLFSSITDEFHFRIAESQFLRMLSERKMKVVEVEVIYNRELEGQYEQQKEVLKGQRKDVRERLVFHGTTKEAIEKIVKEGFKVGGEGVEIRTGAVHGRGVYTATKPDISFNYAAGTNMMLLSKAVLAKEGDDYKSVGGDIYVIKNVHQLLPLYIVHYSCH